MKGLKVIPTQLDSYMKSIDSSMEESLKGQFYEFFCYNELLQNTENIKIVKSNYVERKRKGNFIHTPDGKIIYLSRGVSIAEFDVLGIKDNTIYWWEITRSKKLERNGLQGIKRKMALLDKVFEKYCKIFYLIVPYKIERDIMYDYKIIPEPDYSLFLNNGYFKFNKKIKDCISLYDFERKANHYDYIDDIIAHSYDYFNNKNIDVIEKRYKNYLVERIYDINEIGNGKFKYFDIKHNAEGWIEIKDKYIFMDGKSLYRKGIIKNEISTLLKRLEYVLQ